MLISIILPTKNNEKTLNACLEAIATQSHKEIEVIFVDNFSEDSTKSIAESFMDRINIKIYEQGPERHVQRPFGFEQSSGELLYFIDSDMYITPGLIQESVEIFRKNDKLGALIIPEKNVTQGYGYWSHVKAFERSLYDGDDTVEAARVFRRKVYKEHGGYNQKLISGEDWDLSDRIRKTHEIRRTKNFVWHDEGEIRLGKLLGKKFYYGKQFVHYLNENNAGLAGSKIYFLRGSFYKAWKKYLSYPHLFIGFFIMINASFYAGAAGFIAGKLSFNTVGKK